MQDLTNLEYTQIFQNKGNGFLNIQGTGLVLQSKTEIEPLEVQNKVNIASFFIQTRDKYIKNIKQKLCDIS